MEMLQVYQGIDSFLFLRLRLKLNAMRPLVAPAAYRKRWAVMSTDSNAEYAFLLPLAALVWDKVMRFQPLLLLVGSSWEQPLPESRQQVVLEMLRKMKFRVQVIASSSSINTAAVAQVGRLYACLAEGIKDDDYLLTSDADLIPVSPTHFDSERDWEKKLHLYNPFCCAPLLLPEQGLAAAPDKVDQVRLGAPAFSRGAGVEADHRLLHLPISYAGAEAHVWRELMNLPRSEEEALRKAGVDNILQLAVENRIIHDVGEDKAGRNVASNLKHADLELWHLDQRLWSAKVGAWQHFPAEVEFIPRHGSRDRIDRMHWEVPDSLEGYIDAHLPQPGFDELNWPQVRPLLEKLLRPLPDGERLMGLVDSYHHRYMLAFDDSQVPA
uniref:Nucleotide-diphospho-sugar transferase domain-containing protein n=1 Tax=Hanusia phi TaxID=3032 RepID=A0A7S0F622_9CRYP